jgi:hypothetical protein
VSQFSGFVPIKFRTAGKILLSLGILGIIAGGLTALTGWFFKPAAIFGVSLGLILVGLYLTFVVPREE